MKPTLRQLEYLVAIAETGTFSAAAKMTFVSQPSLSAQIKDVEDHLGAPLLERGRHGALLTPMGHDIVARARIILREVEELKALARESEGTLAGRLKLGVVRTVGPYLLPQVTRQLHAAYPDLRLFVREERTMDLQDHLSDGRFDVVLSTPEDHANSKSHDVVTENIYVCVAPDDPLAQDMKAKVTKTGERETVPLNALKDRELLTLGYGHKFATLVKNLADEAGAVCTGEYEGTSLDAIRQMASMGGSIAILPSLYAISEAKRDPQLIVRRIEHPMAKRQISLIWRHASPMAKKYATIAKVMKETADSIMG